MAFTCKLPWSFPHKFHTKLKSGFFMQIAKLISFLFCFAFLFKSFLFSSVMLEKALFPFLATDCFDCFWKVWPFQTWSDTIFHEYIFDYSGFFVVIKSALRECMHILSWHVRVRSLRWELISQYWSRWHFLRSFFRKSLTAGFPRNLKFNFRTCHSLCLIR